MDSITPPTFGEQFQVSAHSRSSNRYLFNSKEEIFAGLLDYGAHISESLRNI